MSLAPQQLKELGDLLVQQFDDEGKELDQVVRFNLGKRLFVHFVGHGLPFQTVVDKLLEKTEQQGSTFKLCVGVVNFRPNVPEVKAIIGRVMPAALAAPPETAEQVADVRRGVEAIHARLGIAAVRDRIVTTRDDLKRVARDLDLLARYKTLHDCLHILQIKHLRLVANAARQLATDPSACDTLGEYLDQLRFQSIDARTAAQGLPDTPGERDVEMGWVVTLDSVIEGFRTALKSNDSRAALASVYQLKGILRAQPARLDNLLVITARRAPLDRLVETLQEVAKASDEDDGHSSDLSKGILALQRLVPDQMGLIAEHTAWQQVASDLWQADEALYQASSESLEEFQYLWQSLWSKVQAISASNPAADWAKALNQHAGEFEQAFPMPATPPVPAPVKVLFNRFLRDAMFQFFGVDKTLHAQCGEIIKLGEPLQRLLEEVSNDNN
jgi:hypothetical protein